MKKFLLSSCIALSAMTMYADSWTKVTNASDITFDGQYLIVNESNNAVMGTEIVNNTYLTSVNTTAINEGTLTTDGSETFAMVTFEGTDLSSCQVKISALDGTAKGYYTTTAAKKMSLNATSGTNAAVTMTDGNITVKFGDYGTLYYNATNPRFLNYASSQTAVQLYKKEAGGDTDTKTALTLSFPEKSYSVNIGEQFTAPKLSSNPEEAINNISLAYSSSEESVAIVDNSGNVDIKNEGTTVITVSFEGDEIYKDASTSYTLYVIDPNKTTEQDDITIENFDISNAYKIASYTSTLTSVKYTAKAYKNNGLQINSDASSSKSAYKSGLISVENPNKLIIDKIVVYAGSNQSAVKIEVSNTPGTASADGQTGATATVLGASDGISVTGQESNDAITFIPTGEYQYFYLSTSKSVSLSKIEVYYKSSGKEKVEVTFDDGDMNVEFEESKTLQGRIASADVEGLTFSYSSNDTDVATVDNNGMLTLVGAGSTVITATVNDESYTGHASYTLTVTGVYKNFNEIIANAKVNEEIVAKFPMTVGYVNGKYVFVADNQGGYMLIYGSTTYAAGDVIPAGMTATYTIYNGLPELMPTTTPESTEKGEYEIATVAAADVLNQPLNKIVKVVDVNFVAATPDDKQNFTGTVDETSLKFYNQMTLASVEAGTYDVTLIVSTYTKGATEIQTPNQLQPIEYAAVPTAPKVIIDDAEVDTDTGYELQGHDVVVYLTAQEGATIWYKFTAVNTDQNEAATMSEDGFSEYPSEGITIGQLGTLEYYSELNGRTSAIASLQFKGIPTGINEIEAQTGAGTEWFDLSGRRVAAPSKGGIYIKKTGSEVSKYAF